MVSPCLSARNTILPCGGFSSRTVFRESSPQYSSNDLSRSLTMIVMLSSKELDWHTVMRAYDARRLTEQVFDRKKGESRRFRTSDKAAMKGREFLLFLDLMLRCEMSAEIREAKLERPMSVESAVSMVDCVQAREYNSVRTIREIDRKEREIFKTFDVPIPKEVLTGQLIFDPSAEG